MRAVSFYRCDCGVETKLLQDLDDTTQPYTCECGQKFEFLGTILEIYTSKTGFPTSADWKQVSRVNMKASA